MGSVDDVRRLLEIVACDTLSLDNSLASNKRLLDIVTAGARLLEVDQFGPFIGRKDSTGSEPQRVGPRPAGKVYV